MLLARQNVIHKKRPVCFHLLAAPLAAAQQPLGQAVKNIGICVPILGSSLGNLPVLFRIASSADRLGVEPMKGEHRHCNSLLFCQIRIG